MNTETTIIGIALSGDRNALIDLDNIHPHHFADTRNAAIWQLIEDYKQKNPGQGLTPDLLLDKLPSITTAYVTPDYLLDTMNGVHGGHINLAGVHATSQTPALEASKSSKQEETPATQKPASANSSTKSAPAAPPSSTTTPA